MDVTAARAILAKAIVKPIYGANRASLSIGIIKPPTDPAESKNSVMGIALVSFNVRGERPYAFSTVFK